MGGGFILRLKFKYVHMHIKLEVKKPWLGSDGAGVEEDGGLGLAEDPSATCLHGKGQAGFSAVEHAGGFSAILGPTVPTAGPPMVSPTLAGGLIGLQRPIHTGGSG